MKFRKTLQKTLNRRVDDVQCLVFSAVSGVFCSVWCVLPHCLADSSTICKLKVLLSFWTRFVSKSKLCIYAQLQGLHYTG